MTREERIAYAREHAAQSVPEREREREATAEEQVKRYADLSPEEARRFVTAVSKDSRVEAMGPIKTPAQWAKAREAIRSAVMAAAKARHTITYEAIQLVAHEATGMKLSYRMVGRMCMEINRAADGCLLSSIIVRSDTGCPGKGLGPFAREAGYSDPPAMLQRGVFSHFGHESDADAV